MKKFFGFLLCAGMFFGFTACGGDDDGNGGDEVPPSGKFSCKITATATDNKADVTVTPGKGYEATAYKLWVVKKADYKQEIPADAIDGTGTKTQTFEGLSYDETYYAVVHEAEMGYKTTEFFTDEATVEYKALQGSNYYVINLDEESFKLIETKVVADIRPDDITVFFDWWNAAAFSVGTSSGPNSLGQVAGWMALTINNPIDWFGGSYRLINPAAADFDPTAHTPEAIAKATTNRATLTNITADDYVLHFAMKSDAAGSYNLSVFGNGDDNAMTFPVDAETSAYGFKRDGAWHEIEVPMSVFMTSPKFDFAKVNIFALTQSGQPFPKDINLDAVFIYKPAK